MILDGFRVLDLTRVWSGPLAGRILGDLGAEVIHIRNRYTVDTTTLSFQEAEFLGTFPDNDPGGRPWNRHALYNDLHRNKLGITLELDTQKGVEIFKRLVKMSDVVLENYSPRVMYNLGLSYPVLRDIKRDIIMCSMPGYGLSGPYRDYISFGNNLEMASGLASLMGYPGEYVHMSGNPYPDPAAALHAVGAILTALFYRRRSGNGQQIDLSQCESATCLMGEAILGYMLTKKIPERIGNHHHCYAPYGCYPCKGVDKWVVIEICSDEEWDALCRVMGNPYWASDAKFADQSGRMANRDELDILITDWTKVYTHYEVMHMLQKAGVPAGAVLNAEDMLNDPHLAQRGFFWEIDHSEAGTHKYAGQPIRFKRKSTYHKSPAPCLGEHNEYVLVNILGFSHEEVAELEKEGVIGTTPLD